MRARGTTTLRATLYNLFGRGLPAIVGVVFVPVIIRGIGADRFGLLSIAWVLVGYFSVLDLGLGRALTQLVAERTAQGRESEVPTLVGTCISVLSLLGVAAAVVQVGISWWIVDHVLKVPPELRDEAVTSIQILAISLPFVVVTAALRGLLEAQLAFGASNALRIPMVAFTFIAPLMVLGLRDKLPWIVGLLVVGRVVTLAGYWLWCFRHERRLWGMPTFVQRELVNLLRFGGWATVSNILSPLMVNLDRLLIGGLVSVAAVTYYAAPQQVVGQIQAIPAALSTVLFPMFASGFGIRAQGLASDYLRGLRWTVILFLPIVIVMTAFARDGLSLWLGGDFATKSTAIFQCLCIGAYMNGLAQVPFALIQASGRTDVTAKIHLLELAPYLGLVWFLTGHFGILGTAVAWSARVGLDLLLLIIASTAIVSLKRHMLWEIALFVGGGLAMLVLLVLPWGERARLAVVGMDLSVAAVVSWRLLLSQGERSRVLRLGNSLIGRRWIGEEATLEGGELR